MQKAGATAPAFLVAEGRVEPLFGRQVLHLCGEHALARRAAISRVHEQRLIFQRNHRRQMVGSAM